MRLELTAVFREDADGGYVAFVKEMPGAITQGETLEEARENLEDAVRLLIQTARHHTAGRSAVYAPLSIDEAT